MPSGIGTRADLAVQPAGFATCSVIRSTGVLETTAFRRLMQTPARVVVLAAPAGYGKSCLLRAAAETHTWNGLSCAWLGPELTIADRSIAEIDIVLMDGAHQARTDDLFQIIRAACISETRQRLLVATRTLPDADWLTLEASGQLELLRPGELALTRAETQALLQHYSGSSPSSAQVDKIWAVTEGWPIAAQWHGMLARKLGGWNRVSIEAPKAHDDLGRYLNEMIYRELDDTSRDLLFDICDLGPFQAEMFCDVDQQRGSAVLGRLRHESLLVQEAEDGAGKVRLNGILQSFLESKRQEIGRGRNLNLLDRARQWATAHARHADAVEFALRAGKHELAHELLARNCADIVNLHGELRGMLRWTDELRGVGVELGDEVALWRIWALILVGDLALAERELAARKDQIGRNGEPRLQLHADRLELSLAARRRPPGEIVQIADQWLVRWGAQDPFHLAATCVLRALAHLVRGDVLQTRRDMATAQRAACESGSLYADIWIAKAETFIGLRTGQPTAARDIVLSAIDRVRNDGTVSIPTLGALHLLAARVFVELGDMGRARAHLADGHLYRGDTGLVEIHLAASEAAAYIAELEGIEAALRELQLRRQGNIRSTLAQDCFTIRLLLRHEMIAEARERFDTAFEIFSGGWRHVAHDCAVPEYFMPTFKVVLAQLLLAEGLVREADQVSSTLLQATDFRTNIEDRIATQFVAACCAHLLGRRDEARRHMWRALRTASEHRMQQTAVTSCWPVRAMLNEYPDLEEGLRSDALALLAAIRARLGLNGSKQGREAAFAALTAREDEVLHMLDTGLNNEEIASFLAIGVSTVRWHVRNIYSKLGVRNRTGALSCARRLGLVRDSITP